MSQAHHSDDTCGPGWRPPHVQRPDDQGETPKRYRIDACGGQVRRFIQAYAEAVCRRQIPECPSQTFALARYQLGEFDWTPAGLVYRQHDEHVSYRSSSYPRGFMSVGPIDEVPYVNATGKGYRSGDARIPFLRRRAPDHTHFAVWWGPIPRGTGVAFRGLFSTHDSCASVGSSVDSRRPGRRVTAGTRVVVGGETSEEGCQDQGEDDSASSHVPSVAFPHQGLE